MARNDAELMRRIQKGEESAFAEFVRDHEGAMMRFLTRLCADPATAEDLFQETFLKVLQSSRSYQYPKPVRPWLFAIARNAFLKRSDRERREAQKRTEKPEQRTSQLENRIEVDERKRELSSALQSLPARMREAVILRFDQQCSYLEIAEIMGVSDGTVAGWLSEGKERLAKFLLRREL